MFITYDDGKTIPIKNMRLTRGNVLLLLKPKKMSIDDFEHRLTQLAADIAADVGVSTTIIGCIKRWTEIRRLSEEQMKPYGWVRRDRVLAYKDDPREQTEQMIEKLQARWAIDDMLAQRNQEEEE